MTERAWRFASTGVALVVGIFAWLEVARVFGVLIELLGEACKWVQGR